MSSVEAQEMINVYMDDLFAGIITSANPKIAAKEYIKKKRLSYKFRELLKLEHIPQEKKEEMVSKMIAVLPQFTTKEAYIEARSKILDILVEYLADTFKEIDKLLDTLNPQEVENALKIVQRKQKHILMSMREALADMILSDPSEELLVLDEALALAIRLYNKMLENPDNIGKSLFLLILLLRIIGIGRRVFDYKILYEDLAEITPELEVNEPVPGQVFDLLEA